MRARRFQAVARLAGVALVLAVALLASAAPAAACAVCFGAPDDAMTEGMNNGILVLLGTIGLVQVGFVALFWKFWRRAKRLAERRARFQLIEGGAP